MALPSKGCGTCKRRKVKCDEARPTCTRCRNAGIECTGFVKRLRFVDEKPRIQRSAAVSYVQSHEFSITRSSHLVFHSSRMRQSQSASPAHFLAKSLPLTAFKDDVFMSYLVSKFFEEGRHCPLFTPGESPCGLPIEWTSELITTPQKPRHRSWDALAAIVFGQAHGNFDIITNALRLYGQALAELYSQLLDLDHRYSASTLASITALYLYQVKPKGSYTIENC
jgi:hypothetical protein